MSKNERKIWFAENLIDPSESGFADNRNDAAAFVVAMINSKCVDGFIVAGSFDAACYPRLVTWGKAKAFKQITVHKAVADSLLARCADIRDSEEAPA